MTDYAVAPGRAIPNFAPRGLMIDAPPVLAELPTRSPGEFYSITYRFAEEQKNLSGAAIDLYHQLARITDSRIGSTKMWRAQGVSSIGTHPSTLSAAKRELLEREVIWQIGRPHRRYRTRTVLDRVVLYNGKAIKPYSAAGNGRPIPSLDDGLYFSMPNVFVDRCLPWIKPRESRVFVAQQLKCRHDTGIADAEWEHLAQFTNHRYVVIRQALTWLAVLGLIKLLSIDDERVVAALWQPTMSPGDNLLKTASDRPELQTAKIPNARLSTSKRDTLRAQRRQEARANATPSKCSKEMFNEARASTRAPATASPSGADVPPEASDQLLFFGADTPPERRRRRRPKKMQSSNEVEANDPDAAEREELMELARKARARRNDPHAIGGVR